MAFAKDGVEPPFNWTNSHGGLLVRGGDPTSWFAHHHVDAPPRAVDAFAPSAGAPHYNYSHAATRLIAGDDLAILTVSSALQAQLACSARVLCRGVTYNASGVNGSIPRPTTAYLKSAAAFLCNSREQSGCGAPWSAWLKIAPPPPPPAATHAIGDLRVALRADTYAVAWLNVSRPNVTNLSFVPPLSARSALPAIQHLGDVTLRMRPAAASSASYDFFASAWSPFAAKAAPLPPRAGELVAHDITPLLEATRADGAGAPAIVAAQVRRAYRATAKGAFERASSSQTWRATPSKSARSGCRCPPPSRRTSTSAAPTGGSR